MRSRRRGWRRPRALDAGRDHFAADAVAREWRRFCTISPGCLRCSAGFDVKERSRTERARNPAGLTGRPHSGKHKKNPEETPCFILSRASTASARRTRLPCSPAPPSCSARAATSSISASASPISARPTHIVEAAVKALRDGHHGYTPATGIMPLREAVAADLAQTLRRRGLARSSDDRAGRQGDHVCRDPDVRRARRRHPLSRSRFSDLPLDDRVSPAPRRCRCRSARRTALLSPPRRRWR